MVDLESGARCTIRDTGAAGADRYYWTVSVFGEHQISEGRAGEVAVARSQAELAVAAHWVSWRPLPNGTARRQE